MGVQRDVVEAFLDWMEQEGLVIKREETEMPPEVILNLYFGRRP